MTDVREFQETKVYGLALRACGKEKPAFEILLSSHVCLYTVSLCPRTLNL